MDIHEMSFAQEYVQKEKRCIELVLAGNLTVEQIRDEIGYATEMTVWKICGRNGLTYPKTNNQVALEKRNAFIAEHGAEYTWKELSDMFNTGEGTIHRVAKMYGVTLKKDEEAMRRGQKLAKKIQRDNREAELYNKVKEKFPQFEYVGNYKPNGDKSTLDVRCTICGTVKTIQVQALRRNHIPRCPKCYEEEVQRNRELNKEKERERDRRKRRSKATLRMIEKETNKTWEQIEFRIQECKECGKTFAYTGHRRVFCSDECKRKANNRRRDHRIKPEQDIDNITLTKLYERDGGICYICGTKCNWDDYNIEMGKDERPVTLVGPTYPTVEHVKPLSKGGLNSWSNVRLACFECNTKKSTHWEE